MQTIDPTSNIPTFPDLVEVKPARRNELKFKAAGYTCYSILYGNDMGLRTPIRPANVNKQNFDSGFLGEFVRLRMPPTRKNLRSFELVLSDRMIERRETDPKDIMGVFEVLPDGKDFSDYYEILTQTTVEQEFAKAATEEGKMACLLSRLYLGEGEYLGNPKEFNHTLEMDEFLICDIVESLGEVQTSEGVKTYKKEEFVEKPVKELSDARKATVKQYKFGGVLETVSMQFTGNYIQNARDKYIAQVKKIENRKIKESSGIDTMAGGANHINKVFSNSQSKIQQRNKPKKATTSDNNLHGVIGATVISNKKASNAANAASSETPLKTSVSVSKLYSSYNRNSQLEMKKSCASSLLARIATCISTYGANDSVRDNIVRKTQTLRSSLLDINDLGFNRDLGELVKHFSIWALANGTASTDQIVIAPGDLCAFGIWDDKEPEEIPMIVRVARFTNTRLRVNLRIPTTLISWQNSESEAQQRAMTLMNLYDAPSETLLYCLNTNAMKDSPMYQPMSSPQGCGIVRSGIRTPLVVDQELLTQSHLIANVLSQKARVGQQKEEQAMTAYINPRGFNGEFVDPVCLLDHKKNDVLTIEETYDSIKKLESVDPNKVVKSNWYKVSSGEPIENGGPRQITNAFAYGPYRDLPLQVSAYKDVSEAIEKIGQAISSGHAAGKKFLKVERRSSVLTGSFHKLEKRNWKLLGIGDLKRARPPSANTKQKIVDVASLMDTSNS